MQFPHISQQRDFKSETNRRPTFHCFKRRARAFTYYGTDNEVDTREYLFIPSSSPFYMLCILERRAEYEVDTYDFIKL